MFPMELHGISARDAKERAQELILRVDLPETVFTRFPAMLSGGEQQRVAIARALAMDTDLILADEPTGNLDSATSHAIMQLFRELNQQGITVVLITHEQDIAAYAHRVVRVQDGRIVEDRRQ